LHAPKGVIERYRGKYASGWDTIRETRFRRMKAMGIIRPNWKLSPRDPRVQNWEINPLRDWQQRRMEVYAAQVDLLDQGVGTVLDTLRKTGEERNTLVMFLSDNGACAEEIGPHWKGEHIPAETRAGRAVRLGNHPNAMPGGEDTYQSYGIAWANVSNTPFRLYKHYMHEGGIATPMIVRWPAAIQDGGRIVHDVAHVIDLMPTCLELARVGYPRRFEGIDILPPEGRSLVPLLQGKSMPRRTLCWEHEGNGAVRDGKWKLVGRCSLGVVAERGQPWELYDMEADRTETNNLAKQFPVIVQDMARTYEAWAKRCNVLPWRQ
jgi:arylsulfatase